jgi:cytosine/uracil/thiamine/allantoin permease
MLFSKKIGNSLTILFIVLMIVSLVVLYKKGEKVKKYETIIGTLIIIIGFGTAMFINFNTERTKSVEYNALKI